MNAERLLQHFERLAEAPDAILRLRRFILDLAMRGKLVEQDPSDEPASELLKRIQVEKARLVKEGKIKQGKPLQSRANGSMPTNLPKGWLWGCIQEVFTSVTDGDHIPPPKSESGIPLRPLHLPAAHGVPARSRMTRGGEPLISWLAPPGGYPVRLSEPQESLFDM